MLHLRCLAGSLNTPLSSLHRYLPFSTKDVSTDFENTMVLKLLKNSTQKFVRKDLCTGSKDNYFCKSHGYTFFLNDCQNTFRLYSPLE